MTSVSEVILFVKAGADGKRYGACPFCQRIFMILLIKARDHQLHFKVATVNLAKPPDEFKKLSLRRVPAIAHQDNALDNMDDIVQYLDEAFPTSGLLYDNLAAEKACKDIFQKFCFFLKEVSKDSSQLHTELAKLNAYLVSSPNKFLCADQLSHLDCEVAPKLHHIRVACKSLKNLDISSDLKSFWTYFKHVYSEDAFVKSCPSDQEVTLHWADKPETPTLPMEYYSKLIKDTPVFSLNVPGDI